MFLPQKNDEFIKELLKSKENSQLDFKQKISNLFKIAKSLTAFANTIGGKIAIGINDQRKIIGIDPEEEIFMISKAAEEFCIPPIKFESEVFEIDHLGDEKLEEELYVLIINVPKSNMDHLVTSKDQRQIRYIRVDDQNVPDQIS